MRIFTKHSKKLMLIVAVPLILLCAIVFLAREPILYGIGDSLVVQDELHPADVIHVIAGPDYRTDYAIQLYQEGYGRQLFFTGGWCTVHLGFHGEMGRARALDHCQ
jgi:hypothetical protein